MFPSRARRSAPPQMTERSGVRATFDKEARRWRQEFEDRDNEAGERKDLASRWQQYSAETAQDHSATLTNVDNPTVKVAWQVDGNTCGKWRDFPTNLNVLVEQAYKDKQNGVLYLWPPLAKDGDNPQTEYSIDFVAMRQTNKATEFQRRVRRAIIVGTENVEYMGVSK